MKTTQDQAEIAARSRELDRLIRTAALTIHPKGGIKVVGARIGTHPEVIRRSIRQGYFSAGLAARLELAFGTDLLNHEVLIRKVD